jgi:uncharacterized protein HemY
VNGTGAVHDTLGRLHAGADEHGAAIRHFTRSVEIKTTIGEGYQAAVTRTRLAESHLAAGDREAGLNAYRQALSELDELDHPDAIAIRDRLAAVT